MHPLLLVFLIYGFYQCQTSPDYLHLSDYETEVAKAIKNSKGQYTTNDFKLPADVLHPLFLSRMKSYRYKRLNVEYKISKRHRRFRYREFDENVPIQYDISYHEDFKSLVINFWPTSNGKNDWAANLDTRYSSLKLFAFTDPTKNNIHVQTGVLTSLLDKTFEQQMIGDLGIAHGLPIENIIITGHSLGGAYAQCFYFLLHSDTAPGYMVRLKNILKMPQKNIYNTDKTVITRPIIGAHNEHNFFVITWGAFLIIPSEMTVPYALRLLRLQRIFNFIKRKDPVTMVFGGTIHKSKLSEDLIHQKAKKGAAKAIWNLGFMGTARPIGTYWVIRKVTDLTTDLLIGKKQTPQNAVIITKLIDLIYNKITLPYLEQHLYHGAARIGEKAFWHGNRKGAQHLLSLATVLMLPYTAAQRIQSVVSFSVRWTANHNEYGNDIERYIWTDPDYRNPYKQPVIARLFGKQVYPPNLQKQIQPYLKCSVSLVESNNNNNNNNNYNGHGIQEEEPTKDELKFIKMSIDVLQPDTSIKLQVVNKNKNGKAQIGLKQKEKELKELEHYLIQRQVKINTAIAKEEKKIKLKTDDFSEFPSLSAMSKKAFLKQKSGGGGVKLKGKVIANAHFDKYNELINDEEISSMTPVIRTNYYSQLVLNLVLIGLFTLCVCCCYVVILIIAFGFGMMYSNGYNDKLTLNHDVMSDESI